jgi:integrase/recombinase XerD
MTKANIKNEWVKRKFFTWLKEAEGCCDSTVDNTEKAILLYEDFTKQADFGTFNPDRAIDFKKWLTRRQFRGKTISLSTYCTYIRYLRKFFTWLSWQPGYKSKITPDLVSYLKISEKDERIATQYIPRKYPPMEYVLNLAESIKIASEIDMRDRALISFTLLSGMRDQAIVTLPLGCFDEENGIINQNPKQGVQTKFSKYIPSILFKFDTRLLNYVLEWVEHLKTKGFSAHDPLFPRSKTEHGEDNLSFELARAIEPIFWKGTGMMRQIFKNRSEKAGLPYYAPHTYRHLAIGLALKYCKTGEQFKAISQNFGHDHIATTLRSYANYDPQMLSEILKNMNFSGKPSESLEEKLDKLPEQIRDIVLKILLDKQN